MALTKWRDCTPHDPTSFSRLGSYHPANFPVNEIGVISICKITEPTLGTLLFLDHSEYQSPVTTHCETT